jgi:stage II sporulation protein D
VLQKELLKIYLNRYKIADYLISMSVNRILILCIVFVFYSANTFSQLRIRLFSDQPAGMVILTVTEGTYQISLRDGKHIILEPGETVLLTRFNERLAVKTRKESGFICDSVEFICTGATCSFSLRINPDASQKRIYNGGLICKSDLGSVLLINTPEIEDYVAGVVKSEGGSGGSLEYFKTQAIIARTYSYKYEKKHVKDSFNLCDGIHCQVYQGITTDTLITRAVKETKGKVIVDHDSTLIISAFHSNCGGETVASEDLWLTAQPYLKKVVDPYCLSSRNATWEKKISLPEWTSYLKKNGFTDSTVDPSVFNFSAKTRSNYYTSGTFKYPVSLLRNDFQLRSTFFSVISEGDSVLLKGRGYGHGVGLCQEGAMVMAKKGMSFEQIIKFYYTGVQIIDVADVKKPVTDNSSD